MVSIKKITIFGSSQPKLSSETYEDARKIGFAIAKAGWTVINGGYGGVMEASALGAKEAGGATIGITTQTFVARGILPNPYIDTEIIVKT